MLSYEQCQWNRDSDFVLISSVFRMRNLYRFYFTSFYFTAAVKGLSVLHQYGLLLYIYFIWLHHMSQGWNIVGNKTKTLDFVLLYFVLFPPIVFFTGCSWMHSVIFFLPRSVLWNNGTWLVKSSHICMHVLRACHYTNTHDYLHGSLHSWSSC